MRKKYFLCSCKLPMSLQFFAEDENGGDTGGAGGEGDQGGAGGGGDTPPTFDDLLKNGHQEEYNRRLQEAINTAVSEAREKWQAMTDDKLSETEKLAKMNKEEKAQYLQKKKEKELEDKEADITRRELMAEAKNILTEKNLPIGLAEVLNYADADSCNKSIAAVEKAFQEAVETAVQDRLKGGKPPKAAPDGGSDTEAERILKIMRGNA